MKVTDEMVEAALKAHYSAWGTTKKSQDMYRDAMRAALEAVIPLSDPAAWQWLDTANFRKAIPESSNPSEWNPLYRHPAISHAAGQECTLGVGDGSGKLFVHGSYEAIKACQALILRGEAAGQEAPINPAEIDRKLVGGEAVFPVAEVVQAFDGSKKIGSIYWDRLAIGDKLYLTPAQPPASAEVGRKLIDDLNRIAYGYLPDGDGVDTSVALWAEQTLSRMAASSGRKGDEMP